MHHEAGRGILTALSGVGAWLVPAWGCPVCLSAFAGTTSALGMGFLATKAVLTPLMAVLLVVALFGLGFGAKRRRRVGPLVLGTAAAGLLISSKLWPAPWIEYTGLAALLAACVWNTRIAAPPSIGPSSLGTKASGAL
jgi:hypothetical protein